MSEHEKVNILLVDDQPARLLSYESILGTLGQNNSGGNDRNLHRVHRREQLGDS